MEKYIYTDLACELGGEAYKKTSVISHRITKINMIEHKKEAVMHTVFFTPKLWNLNDSEFIILRDEVANELKAFVEAEHGNMYEKELSVLVIGLGNPHLTSDALGAETVKKITVTRHISNIRGGISISAVSPDVMGNTGIETVDAVKAYSELVNPTVIIAVDSLLAKSYERLSATIQISNGGITPGGGIKTGGKRLDLQSLGIPVISLGVPMAVSSSTMVAEAMKRGGMSNIPEGIQELLDNGMDFLVTPKESDLVLQSAALLLSSAVDMALQR